MATECSFQNATLGRANSLRNRIGLLLRGLDRHRTGTTLFVEMTAPDGLRLFKHTAIKTSTRFLLSLLLLSHSFGCWANDYHGDRGVLQAILGDGAWKQPLHTAQISTSCSHH